MKKGKQKSKSKEKLVVLPVAIRAAEIRMAELIRLEQWSECLELLEWMISIPDSEPSKRQEWMDLRDAILGFPETVMADEPEDETVLYARMMRDKSKYDPESVNRCLQVLRNHPSIEQQMTAIDQLMHMEHEAINRELIRYLADRVRPGRVQFKVLFALKVRGWKQDVVVPGNVQSRMLSPDVIPLTPGDWPEGVRMTGMLLIQRMSDTYPSFSSLIRSFWEEWLQRVFLEAIYEQLCEFQPTERTIWAEAFFGEAVRAWTGTGIEVGTKFDPEKVNQFQMQIRPFFQPFGS